MLSKNILIIGASGTLGTALITELVKQDVTIRAYSRNEYRLFLLREKFKEYESKMRYLIGDICDLERLNMAMTNADVVINCAAMKRVEMCDENPFACLNTNVVGVQKALECAVKNNIETFIQISTDKAVLPVNIYGHSKAMSEYLVLDAVNWCGKAKTKFIVVRSGNILGSSGSVLEIWQKQKEQGLPLTVSDLNATRYGASKESISKAILDIAEYSVQSGLNGLVVLDMKEYSIKDLLAEFSDCDVIHTGLKPFEKLHELLYRDGEIFTKWKVI
jgi:FlaA1/EpsC-like NDP-sugar epimerase